MLASRFQSRFGYGPALRVSNAPPVMAGSEGPLMLPRSQGSGGGFGGGIGVSSAPAQGGLAGLAGLSLDAPPAEGGGVEAGAVAPGAPAMSADDAAGYGAPLSAGDFGGFATAADNAAADAAAGGTGGFGATDSSENGGFGGESQFMSGGYTGAGHPAEPAGTVHRGEVVIPAQQVARYGLRPLMALVEGSVPPSRLAALARG